MGKHSDPDPRWFWLSLGAAAGKAVAALLVAGLIVVGVTRWLDGGGDQQAAAPVATTPETPEPDADPVTEAPTADEPTGFAAEPASEDDADATAEALEGGTVQVLNGSGDPDALDQAVAALEELGYDVVATSRASRGYDRTTVFWSDGYEDEARALRGADDRFGVLQPNDRLAQTVNLHVVLGRDWAPAE